MQEDNYKKFRYQSDKQLFWIAYADSVACQKKSASAKRDIPSLFFNLVVSLPGKKYLESKHC